jgi:chitin disaccharide deacetylase
MSRRVILNADDLGYEPNVSRGIVEALRAGVVSSSTLMVNTPFSAEAATLARGLPVGLHLNLVRFRALTDADLELDEGRLDALSADFVEAETLAQLDRLAQLLGQPATHLDVHRHAHRHLAVLGGLKRAAQRTGLPVRSLDAPMRRTLRAAGVATNDVFLGEAGDQAWWTPARFEAELAALPAHGVVELMCHPGYRPTALKSGYGAQREVELATFTSPAAREALARFGVRLESWREVGR